MLLVSDLHAGNQYALMRTIIEEEDIDLVIDTGDLVNFGTVTEGDASGMFAGIASLPVPYLFTRGNHDATSATDRAILDRMAAHPQCRSVAARCRRPTTSWMRAAYASVGSTTHAGSATTASEARTSNSPRRRRSSTPSRSRTRSTSLVSHEPWAVQDVPRADVAVNGHMHTPDLEGNRIQAGTFTGGGPLTHFVGEEDGEELIGQPSAFDVLTFGETCRLTSVTRYRYRNVIEGRPAYDDVSLVNGSRIDTAIDPDRTCANRSPAPARSASLTRRERCRLQSPEPTPSEAD